jgi:hypothetical protein
MALVIIGAPNHAHLDALKWDADGMSVLADRFLVKLSHVLWDFVRRLVHGGLCRAVRVDEPHAAPKPTAYQRNRHRFPPEHHRLQRQRRRQIA